MASQEIPVFFTIDEKYAPYLAVALQSLTANLSRDSACHIFVLHEDLSERTQRYLQRFEQPNVRLTCIPMQECYRRLWSDTEQSLQGQVTDHISNRLRADYFTLTIYFRLFIPDLFPQYDKAIYLDSDVVVCGDIAQMFRVPLGDNLLGACRDHSIHDIPELVDYITYGIGAGKEGYFNSGVLLMNMRRLRELQLGKRFLEVLSRWHFDCIAPDQDYLNALCMHHVVYLDRRWDTMPNNKQPETTEPLLIHYNLFEKPWMYDGIQYADYFWEYAAQLDDECYQWLKHYKATYSDTQKRADAESLARLVARAGSIAHTPDNFREVFESGREKRLL
ncbi:MAG: glycosyltransferase family 8 protein [Paludibacteraceae bacterium]